MAMGIFEQLGWLTTRVKRLCCAINGIKTGGLKSSTVDISVFEGGPGYDITEGGIYQFFSGTGAATPINFAYPTSVGQTMYIINASADQLTVLGLSPANRPFDGATISPMPDIQTGEIWQIVSIDGVPFGEPGLAWRGFKVYPNIV